MLDDWDLVSPRVSRVATIRYSIKKNYHCPFDASYPTDSSYRLEINLIENNLIEIFKKKFCENFFFPFFNLFAVVYFDKEKINKKYLVISLIVNVILKNKNAMVD